jgi:hypothetical protein
MAKFKVLRRVDAWIDYVAEIEALNPAEAAALAYRSPREYVWTDAGREKFPTTLFVALDERGREMRETEQMSG